jgi:DNA-binding NtrC family response regulator
VTTALSTYHWPGNIRELRNIIERAAAFCYGDTIDERGVREALAGMQGGQDYSRPESITRPISLREHITRFERTLLKEILDETNGNITKAARALKMDRGNLSKKLKKYGLT